MFCSSCGTRQSDHATACASCGAALARAQPAEIGAEPPPSGPYVPAWDPAASSNGYAIAGLVCGLLGLFPFWIGFILCVLAIVFSGIGLSHASRYGGVGRGPAVAGLVLGILFIVPASCGI